MKLSLGTDVQVKRKNAAWRFCRRFLARFQQWLMTALLFLARSYWIGYSKTATVITAKCLAFAICFIFANICSRRNYASPYSNHMFDLFSFNFFFAWTLWLPVDKLSAFLRFIVFWVCILSYLSPFLCTFMPNFVHACTANIRECIVIIMLHSCLFVKYMDTFVRVPNILAKLYTFDSQRERNLVNARTPSCFRGCLHILT